MLAKRLNGVEQLERKEMFATLLGDDVGEGITADFGGSFGSISLIDEAPVFEENGLATSPLGS